MIIIGAKNPGVLGYILIGLGGVVYGGYAMYVRTLEWRIEGYVTWFADRSIRSE